MAAHHRHQASLEGVLDFEVDPLRDEPSNVQAADIFARLVRLFQPTEGAHKGYKRITLLSSIYSAVKSKPAFLRYMFIFLEKNNFGITNDLDLDFSLALSRYDCLDSWDRSKQQKLEKSLAAFADHLVDALFLPMKASGATPILSPDTPTIKPRTTISAVEQRDHNLRHSCLRRDGHRCVITQKFDFMTFTEREARDNEVYDDDGEILTAELEKVEVSHIIPFSLASQQANENPTSQQAKEKPDRVQVAMHLLNMFDPGVVHLIDGPGIDRPYNAISLTALVHLMFGSLQLYFDPTEETHTYIIRFWKERTGSRMNPAFPIRRTLRLDPDHTVDPPSPRLLAIHRAIGQILYLSAAGLYIDKILRDLEYVRVIAEDGSTDLGNFVSASLGGWAEVSAMG